jgi:hypothetical protein
MVSLGPRTPRAKDGCSPEQLIIYYPSPIHRVIYYMPLTVGGMHGAPSMLRVSGDMRMRSDAEKNTTGIMGPRRGVRQPELSRPQLQPAIQPGGGRGITTKTPLPGTDIIIVDRKIRVEYWHLLHALGPSNGLLISRSPMPTSTSPSRIQEVGWLCTQPPPEPLGQPKT